MDSSKIWTLIQTSFPILRNSFELPDSIDLVVEEDLYNSIHVIRRTNLASTVHTLVFTRTEDYVKNKVVVDFWSYFQKPLDSVDGFLKFYKAVNMLYMCYFQFSPVMAKLDLLQEKENREKFIYGKRSAVQALKVGIRAALLSKLPVSHKTIIEIFYETALKKEEKKDVEAVNEVCGICALNDNECLCLQNFYDTNRKLAELDLLEPLVGQVLTSLIYSYIESHIQRVCKDSFDVSYIQSLHKWLKCVVISWLKGVYCHEGHSMSDCIDKFSKKLVSFLYETYTKIRINQLFNIIIEFPESSPALEDLRVTLPSTDLRPVLTQKLQKAMETRLLHPGVSTPDILTAYIAAIRSMRVLDPTGLLLQTVTQPVHQYLRGREDTVRCVVSSLTEEGPNDLADELVRNEAIEIGEGTAYEDNTENWEKWMPDPVDAEPVKLSSSRRTSDIISMLVNVYGSKELFINEYRTLLADRLLSQFWDSDMEKEIRYLELLKLRFGESQLHYCEVVLKDVQDARRINQHIKQDSTYVENIPLSAMIVSTQFWPAFKEEKLELYHTVTKQMEAYTKAFETLKGSRTLHWKNHLGVVDLEIELENRTISLSVTPIQATIIMHFQDKSEWTLDELSRIIQVPPTVLRKKIGFWQSHGLLVEKGTDVFYLVEEQNDSRMSNSEIVVEDYESESVMASAQDQREEELQTFWSYIVGMLTNLDTLSLERIHQMLKMFAFQGPITECSMQELRKFLDRKVREHQLVLSSGLYKLPKP